MITTQPIVGTTYLVNGTPCVVLCLADNDTRVVYSPGNNRYWSCDINTFMNAADTIEANEPTIIQKLHGLIGYVQNGSDTVIRIFQDDVTKMYSIMAGYNSFTKWEVTAASLEAVIDKAYKEHGEKI